MSPPFPPIDCRGEAARGGGLKGVTGDLGFSNKSHHLGFTRSQTTGHLGMRVKVKRKERLELEEERQDLLDLFVALRRPP